MGKKIISLPVCESTNSLMMAMSSSNKLEEGCVIICESQTKGRGQAGSVWVAEEGSNLTFSVFLKPEFLEPVVQFNLNMAVGLAVADVIEMASIHRVKVKWPNDVMVNEKKVCGILIENQIQGQQFTQSIVGIGLNVNQKEFEWPKATSLCLEANQYFNRNEIFEWILEKLEMRYNQLKTKQFMLLRQDYYRSLFWMEEKHEFMSDGKIFSGTIKGVDEFGRLQISTENRLKGFNFKEVSFIS